MAAQSNIKLPRQLSLLSVLLLFFFLLFWNVNQYKSEKEELKDTLTAQLQLAHSEVKDAHLISDLVLFIEDEEDHIDSLTSIKDSTFWALMDTTKEVNSGVRILQLKSEIYSDSTQIKKKNSPFSLTIDDKGVTRWDSNWQDRGLDYFDSHPKSSRILNHFISGSTNRDDKVYDRYKEKLEANNLPFSFTVWNDKENKKPNLKIEFASSGFTNSLYAVDTEGYKFYILKNMWPNFLFSIILMGIVALAFYSLLKNIADQQKLVKTKNEFINNMTHELKTPISTVALALEAISDFGVTNEPAKAQEYIEISQKEVSKLSALVDKVLNIAVSDNNTEKLDLKPIDLELLTNEAVSSLNLSLQEQDAKIVVINNANNTTIMGDKMHLSNTVVNLLDNALKYNNKTPQIAVEISEQESNLCLKISDNGIGISTDDKHRIFQRFYRVPTDDQHDIKGHGLGLSYVKDVIERHGGSIALESALGKGSSFTILLPQEK